MRTEEFDYSLPEELIAQSPAVPRESCRLLVVHREDGRLEHRAFSDILDYLEEDDLLVVNDTKVMPARLLGHKSDSDTAAEVLLLKRIPEREHGDGAWAQEHDNDARTQCWEALVRPGRRLKPGSHVCFEGLDAEIVDWAGSDDGGGGRGRRIIRLEPLGAKSVDEALQELGRLPLPPYIKDFRGDTALYQTVYAHEQNSAAAPTAGLHFSERLLDKAQKKGCGLATVCLEIGLDTFRKVEEEHIADHLIHSEVYTVPEETVRAVGAARERGGRIIAVGTTAVRALESAADDRGRLRSASREQTRLYITPGYEYRIVDTLLTNFHTPRSTLLMLVSAFAGHELMKKAYEKALEERYRFLSFGDAMLLL